MAFYWKMFFFFLGNSDGMYHMKILIPCITAGAIIGKGGETIAQLQTETNTKIKMSKTNDFYPGKLIWINVELIFLWFVQRNKARLICVCV